MLGIESNSASSKSEPQEWVDRHGDFLYRFALARVRREDAAEELVQETLLAAWRGQAEFAGTASERTWLTAILKRKAIDWLRRRIRERSRDSGQDPDASGFELFTRRGVWKAPPGKWSRNDPTGPLEREEFWNVLNACVAKLPPRLQDAFALKYLDDAAGEEVCRELGLTQANLWVMLHRARLRMWLCLSRNWFGEDPAPEEER